MKSLLASQNDLSVQFFKVLIYLLHQMARGKPKFGGREHFAPIKFSHPTPPALAHHIGPLDLHDHGYDNAARHYNSMMNRLQHLTDPYPNTTHYPSTTTTRTRPSSPRSPPRYRSRSPPKPPPTYPASAFAAAGMGLAYVAGRMQTDKKSPRSRSVGATQTSPQHSPRPPRLLRLP